jgi:hypothetical protein
MAASFYNGGVSHLNAGPHKEAAIDFRIARTHSAGHSWATTSLGVTLTWLGF